MKRPRKTTRKKDDSSLAQKAYDAIEELIVTLELKPGRTLSEATLVKRVGIGRTPVREALLRLSKEHLIEFIPRKGIVVSAINIGDHLVLLETRRVLERIMAERAAKRANEEQRKRFAELSERIVKAAEDGKMSLFIQADHEFDQQLGEVCRNPFASEACTPLRAQCRRFWYHYHHNEDLNLSARLHAGIMRAIADGDGDAAGRASDELMNYLEKLTREAIDK